MIVEISDKNLDEILPLISRYQAFYNVENMSDEKNKEFFSQFGPNSSQGCLFGCWLEDKAVAFATVYFSFSSTLCAKVAIMNDLYVDNNFRRKGIGKELIYHCKNFALKSGAVRLQWLTQQKNSIANDVYTAIGASKSDWNFYWLT